MQVQQDIRKMVDEILGPKYCSQDYNCSEPTIEQYQTDGHVRFVACIRSDPGSCTLAVPRAGCHECRCVLRATLLEKLH